MPKRIDGPEGLASTDEVAYCPDCDQIWDLSDDSFPRIFSWVHTDHTGHDSCKIVTAGEFFDEIEGVKWEITCTVCDWGQTTANEDEIEKLSDKHKVHTGHRVENNPAPAHSLNPGTT